MLTIKNVKSVSLEEAAKIISRRLIISENGIYVVKVKSIGHTKNGTPILNTACCTEKQLAVYHKNTSGSRPQYQFELNRCQLSFALNNADFKIHKGEFVEITVAQIPVNKGSDTDFRIVAVRPLPMKTAKTMSEMGETTAQAIAAADILQTMPIESANIGDDFEMPL
jgi:hypothetical protein